MSNHFQLSCQARDKITLTGINHYIMGGIPTANAYGRIWRIATYTAYG